MKKLIFLFGIILINGVIFAQTVAKWDSIRVPNTSDTVVAIRTDDHNFSVIFDPVNLDATDATINIGACPNGLTFATRNVADTANFIQFDDLRLPVTISSTSTVIPFEKSLSNFKFLCFQLTAGSVTSGLYLRYYLTIW